MRCFVLAGFLLTSASHGPSVIAELLVIYTPFLSNAPTGQTADHIFTLNGSNDTNSRNDVPFLASVDIAAHLGDQIAQKTQFWGRE